jgi:hypothetical protein
VTKNEILAREIVARLLNDLEGRKGFDHMWEELDADIQWEIQEEWRKLVIEALS